MLNTLKKLNRTPQKRIEDEFLKWLGFANAGMLNPGNTYCMDYAIQALPSTSPIVEIGSFCGLSTNVMSYFLAKHGKQNKIITSDRWIFEGAEKGGNLGQSQISHPDYRTFVMDTFKRNIQFFSGDNLPYPIEVFSDDFFELWNTKQKAQDIFGREIELGGSISFAYIDGNHTYEYAKRDFENVAMSLEVGGFILFDDSADGSDWGSAALMKEVAKHPEFEVTLKNPNYLLKKIK